jgi:hypothetical protein
MDDSDTIKIIKSIADWSRWARETCKREGHETWPHCHRCGALSYGKQDEARWLLPVNNGDETTNG